MVLDPGSRQVMPDGGQVCLGHRITPGKEVCQTPGPPTSVACRRSEAARRPHGRRTPARAAHRRRPADRPAGRKAESATVLFADTARTPNPAAVRHCCKTGARPFASSLTKATAPSSPGVTWSVSSIAGGGPSIAKCFSRPRVPNADETRPAGADGAALAEQIRGPPELRTLRRAEPRRQWNPTSRKSPGGSGGHSPTARDFPRAGPLAASGSGREQFGPGGHRGIVRPSRSSDAHRAVDQ